MPDPWLKLEKLAEAELRLVQAGDLNELRIAMRATRVHLAALPAKAPASARPHLLRTSALRSRLEIELRRTQERLLQERQTRRRAQQLSRRYHQTARRGYSVSA